MTISGTELKIRSLQPTDADYAAWLSVRNAVWKDEPLLLAQLKYEESIWPDAFFSQRFIVTLQDTVVAAAHLLITIGSISPANMILTCLCTLITKSKGLAAIYLTVFSSNSVTALPN